MVASKVILAVAFVSAVAVVQIDARPASENWAEPFETALKNIAANVTKFVGEHSSITDNAKNTLNSYADTFKTELTSFTKQLDEKSGGVKVLFQNATKQFETTVDTLNKNMPADLTPAKLTEKYQEVQKTIKATSEDLWKKAGGNADIQTDIKAFTKKQFDLLTENFQAYQKKLSDATKQ